ncbi:MAG: hypothetical protein LBS27_11405, partial [Bifidobacteriaceae bacterium]|nr:hypothetical protein [Bifidobacteriaceae bacterium]
MKKRINKLCALTVASTMTVGLLTVLPMSVGQAVPLADGVWNSLKAGTADATLVYWGQTDEGDPIVWYA